MINDCVKHLARCNEWQTSFIKSVQEQNSQGKALSEKQIHKLDEIWEQVT